MRTLPATRRSGARRAFLPITLLALAACASRSSSDAVGAGGSTSAPARSVASVTCAPDNGGFTLPAGFCASVFADSLGVNARQMAVAPNGDVFVAMAASGGRGGAPAQPGGVVALRDADGDGRAEVTQRFGQAGGNGIALRGEWLYVAMDSAVIRYRLPAGAMQPTGAPETIVTGLPFQPGHRNKTVAFGRDGALYVNVGSPSNACQLADRQKRSPGKDPCPELDTRAGIWRFDADKPGQTQAGAERFATGLRNSVAMAMGPDGQLYAVPHGRDNFFQNWPEHYDEEESAEQPSEELVRVERGGDYGWPYCYHDNAKNAKVLAPEYGGDGTKVDRCAGKKMPLVAFPGHWAPNGMAFYTGTQFPAKYRGGVFVAFHGSWNRAPRPQAGFNVAFAPFENGQPTGRYEVFADKFAGDTPPADRNQAPFRPTAVATGADGSLYISETQKGRVWKVVWKG